MKRINQVIPLGGAILWFLVKAVDLWKLNISNDASIMCNFDKSYLCFRFDRQSRAWNSNRNIQPHSINVYGKIMILYFLWFIIIFVPYQETLAIMFLHNSLLLAIRIISASLIATPLSWIHPTRPVILFRPLLPFPSVYPVIAKFSSLSFRKYAPKTHRSTSYILNKLVY